VNFASLFSGVLLGYSLAVPPGPMNALIAAWSLRSFRHGFAVGAGAMSADFLLMLIRRDNVDKRKRKKEAYPPAGTSLGIRSQV
jgi:arginine exporter protein ArgO